MKHNRLNDALNEISDKYLAEAAKRKKRPSYWVSITAAVLALAVLAGAIFAFPNLSGDPISLGGETTPPATEPATNPPYSFQEFEGTLTPVQIGTVGAPYLLSSPKYPEMAPYSTRADASGLWYDSQRAIHYTELGYADSLTDYFKKITPAVLASDGENAVFSPLNIYMALAMLAETSGGQSRRQILDLLGLDSIEALRAQAGQVWRAHYNNDGMTTSLLGSSLWLNEAADFHESTVNTLADYYYASVFRGDMRSAAYNGAFQDWLNENTGNLLQDQVGDVLFSPETLLAIATTIYYQAQWYDQFYEQSNTTGIFHAPSGDREATYMNKTLFNGAYHWGEDFGAVSLGLKNQDRIWLILPDEGKTPEDILESGCAMDMILSDGAYENSRSANIRLSLPKFDVCADTNLKSALQSLGITDVFDAKRADFSPLLPDEGVFVDSVQHAARVSVDEDGVTASAFTVLLYAGAAMPPDENVDFILDRPFLFVVESRDGLPLFAGVVNNP